MRLVSREAVERMLAGIWPRDLTSQVLFETKSSIKHFKSWLFERSKYRGKTNLKLNIGCGANTADGWVNIDLEGPPGVYPWDCRRGMPFDNGSVASIFAEHIFEHFDPGTGAYFLTECYRCLRNGGIVRIVVPDAGRYLKLYQGDWSGFVPVRPLVEENGNYRDFWLDRVYRTKMEFINEIFRQGTQHKFAYDAETLVMMVRDAGFDRVIQQSFGVSDADEIPLDTKERGPESLYVEGIK